MNSTKLAGLVLGVSASIALIGLSASSTSQPWHDRQSAGGPTHQQIVDGGAPQPPIPWQIAELQTA